IDEAVASAEVRAPELDLARQIISSLAAPFDPSELHSEYRASLRGLLEAKLAGEEITVPEAPAPAPVADLMEALRASVVAAKKRPATGPPARAAKPAPARKRAAKR